MKNVFDTLQYEVGAGGAGLSGNESRHVLPGQPLIENSTYTLAPPRTYGVELHYKFF